MAKRMINILIVDDEAMICEGMASTIPWEEIGVHVTGKAYNGKQALDIIQKHPVDLVLTDVYMPEMDGLALAEFLSDEYPGIEIVMFSGYDEFEYARQGIRLGVRDYLLKPVDIDELMELVQNLRDSIREKSISPSIAASSYTALYAWVLHYLFNAPVPEEVPPEAVYYRVMTSEKTDYSDNTEYGKPASTWKKAWDDEITRKLSHTTVHACFFSNHENERVTIFFAEHPEYLETERLSFLWESFYQNSGFLTAVGISTIQSDLALAATVYQEAQTSLSQIRGTGTLISFYSRQAQQKSAMAYSKETEKELKKAILNYSASSLEALTYELCHSFQGQQINVNQVLQILRELEIVLKNALYELSNHNESEADMLHLQQPVDEKVYNSLPALHRLFLEDLHHLAETLHAASHHNWIIDQALQYIHANYHKDIKAQAVAEKHFITPNYFSMLFKQDTGLSFSEYLNSLRIEKAAELLGNTSNRVFEIAEYVGYKEYKYFVKVFKNHLGVTPTHYRNLNNRNQ